MNRPFSFVSWILLAVTSLCLAEGQSTDLPRRLAAATLLYQNDFETPNANQNPGQQQCGTNLDNTPINTMFGGQTGGGTSTGFFRQAGTVETVVINSKWDPHTEYVDTAGIGGNYAIGMLNTNWRDALWMDFNAPTEQEYFNVEMDISKIDVLGCGGPFGRETHPKYQLTLTDRTTGTVVDVQEVTGADSPNLYTFVWTHHVVTFNKGSATDLTLQFILLESGYACFDNLKITSTVTAIDDDNDSVVNEDDLCSGTAPGESVDQNGCSDAQLAALQSGANGDPHFVTFRGERFDFHGECSLELVSDPTFMEGKGLDIHIKTEIRRNWSFIKSAAIRIGQDILEVEGGTDANHYWFNNQYQGKLSSIGGFSVSYKKANSKSRSYTIKLSRDDKIELRTYKDFVRVNIVKPRKELYGNTIGILGDFITGKKLARNGHTIIEDYNEFGQEWQVQPSSPQLFHEVSGPQAPFEKCILPSQHAGKEEKNRRRLGQATISEEQAKAACEKVGVPHQDVDACIFDVLATEDYDMAGSY